MGDNTWKAIKDIVVGDEVISFDPVTLKIVKTRVVNHFVKKTDKRMIKITLCLETNYSHGRSQNFHIQENTEDGQKHGQKLENSNGDQGLVFIKIGKIMLFLYIRSNKSKMLK